MTEASEIIYLDYHATTPVDPRVAEKVLYYMTEGFGNASSTDHEIGDRAEAAIKTAARYVADLVDASPKDVIFTSGSTESINIAIQGTVKHLEESGIKPRIAVSTVEHKAVLDTCAALERQGRIEVIKVPVDIKACIDLEQLDVACSSGIHLLCIMAANNEVGTLYPIEKIAHIAQHYGVPFLCDASQAVGKIPIRFNEWGITMLSLSAHKIYGPQGVGALVIQKGYPLTPLFYGGGHQRGLRSGTLNLPGIVGLGEACRLRTLEMTIDETEICQKRDRLQTLLQQEIPTLAVNGNVEHRLAGNLHVSIPSIPNSALIARLRHQLAISTGSACSSGIESPSHVLEAMNLPPERIEGALRISIGKFTKDHEISAAASLLANAVDRIQVLMND